MDRTFMYLVGTAGCGKSCLASALASWMQGEGYNPAFVNLDPGIEGLPYEPDVNICDWISIRDLMEEHGLGPNGAQVAASDMLALNSKEMVDAVDRLDADIFIVDTPGQIELFAFRSSSRLLIDALGRDQAMLAYIFDPNLARQPTGFASSLMLSATVEFRLSLPTINVLSKTDLLTPEEMERISEWASEPASLLHALDGEAGAPHTPLTNELVKALESLGVARSIVASSAESGEGMADIFSAARMLFAGGEDLEKHEPPKL
jgi:hypothetical protein